MANPNPATGFQDHPENINRAGRPKRKTLTELLHLKLDNTPKAWETIVAIVLKKIIEEGDKEIIKEFWHYTDGMPKQGVEHSGSIELPQPIYGSKSTNK